MPSPFTFALPNTASRQVCRVTQKDRLRFEATKTGSKLTNFRQRLLKCPSGHLKPRIIPAVVLSNAP